MNFLRMLTGAAAVFAGWWGTALYREGKKPDTLPPSPPVAAATPVSPATAAATLRSLRRPAAGSAEMARIAALIAAVPDGEVEALSASLMRTWPPGTSRELAGFLFTLPARRKSDPASDPLTPLPSADELEHEIAIKRVLAQSVPHFRPGDDPEFALQPKPSIRYTTRELEEDMKAGLNSPRGDNWKHTLGKWLSEDPGAASAAVLAIPPGAGRASAVEAATAAMAENNAAGALELFLQSGEPKAGSGVARAWARAVTEASSGTNGAFLLCLSAEQRDSLFSSVAAEMEPRRPGENAGRYRGADRAWVREGNLMPLAEGILESGATGPGVEAFFRQLSRFPEDAMAAYSLLALSPLFHDSRAAEQDILYTALQEQNAASAGNNVEAFLSGKPYFSPPFESNIDPNALLERTAPSMIAPLASTGRLPEALQVLERIHDPAAWSTAFQNLLPAWMDADPAAARAAFNTAPLTALERERLQRLPAFLLSR